MTTIWKFPIEITDIQQIRIPRGSKILSAQFQGEQLCLWAIVDPTASKINLTIRVQGTGNPFVSNPDCWDFVDTVQQRNGMLGVFVWHIFVDNFKQGY